MPLITTLAAASICLAAGADQPAAEPDIQADTQAPPSEISVDTNADRVHATVDLSFTSQYFFRGIIQETDGFIFQPSVEFGFDLYETDTWSLGAYAGIWNSFHDQETGSADPDDFVSKWYEIDYYLGFSFNTGRVTADLAYTIYASPNDAYTSVEEFIFTLAFDDEGLLGPIAFAPYATLALEVGDGTGDGGANQGLFLGLGIEPAHTFENSPIGDVTLSVPIEAGFSLDDYYEGATGDESFGYFTAGLAASVPLPAPSGFGAWSFSAGVDYLLLGDSNQALNAGDDSEFIVHAGVTFEF